MDRLSVRQVSPEGALFRVYVLSGELDIVNVGKFVDTVVDALEHGGRHFCLDLSDVTWCDNGSLFTLLGVRHAANHVGGSLSCTGVSPAVRDALVRTELGELLPVIPE
ncbi:STAS domain-containing protein [Streptomyces sp. SDT5-1]|uniref:STAS domain-containing protein n=1 Tax=Streptomyces sp. SDT5-1 TaxID=3406418 RepID=UPI003FD0A656